LYPRARRRAGCAPVGRYDHRLDASLSIGGAGYTNIYISRQHDLPSPTIKRKLRPARNDGIQDRIAESLIRFLLHYLNWSAIVTKVELSQYPMISKKPRSKMAARTRADGRKALLVYLDQSVMKKVALG
jgi:hypothetical protein